MPFVVCCCSRNILFYGGNRNPTLNCRAYIIGELKRACLTSGGSALLARLARSGKKSIQPRARFTGSSQPLPTLVLLRFHRLRLLLVLLVLQLVLVLRILLAVFLIVPLARFARGFLQRLQARQKPRSQRLLTPGKQLFRQRRKRKSLCLLSQPTPACT